MDMHMHFQINSLSDYKILNSLDLLHKHSKVKIFFVFPSFSCAFRIELKQNKPYWLSKIGLHLSPLVSLHHHKVVRNCLLDCNQSDFRNCWWTILLKCLFCWFWLLLHYRNAASEVHKLSRNLKRKPYFHLTEVFLFEIVLLNVKIF